MKNRLIKFLTVTIIILKVNSFSLGPTKCTNEKQVNSYSEYISEFQKGPCTPFIFVPGLMGSNLRIVADCKLLEANKNNYPQINKILHACPFMCRNRDRYENSMWLNAKSMLHYLLFNDFNLIFRRRECLVEMMKVYHKYEFKNDLKSGKFPDRNVTFMFEHIQNLFNLGKIRINLLFLF